jgi:hypothetical protein
LLSNSFELDLAKAGFNRLVKSRLGPIQLIENIPGSESPDRRYGFETKMLLAIAKRLY